MYSAWFQTVTELGGDIFPFRSGVEKKENQNGTENCSLWINHKRGPARLGADLRVSTECWVLKVTATWVYLRNCCSLKSFVCVSLWGQMLDMFKMQRSLLRLGLCRRQLYEHRPALGSTVVLRGERDEQPEYKEDWRWLLSEHGAAPAAIVPEVVLQMETGRRQWEGGKGKFLISFCNQKCDFLGWLEPFT